MYGNWKVTSQYLDGGVQYAVYRLRDAAATDHSGNREYATGYTEDKEEAYKAARELNNEAARQLTYEQKYCLRMNCLACPTAEQYESYRLCPYLKGKMQARETSEN